MSIGKSLRFGILERDDFTCVYCGAVGSESELQVDHIHPKSKGGADEDDNLVASCFECNIGKSNRVGVVPHKFTEQEKSLRLDLFEATRSIYFGMPCATFHILKCCISNLRKSGDSRENSLAEHLDFLAELIPELFPSDGRSNG